VKLPSKRRCKVASLQPQHLDAITPHVALLPLRSGRDTLRPARHSPTASTYSPHPELLSDTLDRSRRQDGYRPDRMEAQIRAIVRSLRLPISIPPLPDPATGSAASQYHQHRHRHTIAILYPNDDRVVHEHRCSLQFLFQTSTPASDVLYLQPQVHRSCHPAPILHPSPRCFQRPWLHRRDGR
jgi:hypothetical protein